MKTHAPSRADRSVVRAVVAATAVLGLLGLPAAWLFGEPYPWLMMPGFGGHGGFDGNQVDSTTAAFVYRFADGTSANVDPPTLFNAVPGSNYHALTTRFSPVSPSGGRLEHIAAALFPNLSAAERSQLDLEDPELQAWFRRQAQRLFPGREARQIDVHWQWVAIGIDGTRRVIDTQRSALIELRR